MGEEKEGATYSSSQASAPEQGMPQRWEQGHRLASSNPSNHPPTLSKPHMAKLACYLLCSSPCLGCPSPPPLPCNILSL